MNSYDKSIEILSKICQNIDNISILNRNICNINDEICIIGATLWSNGDLKHKNMMNDFKQIQDLLFIPSKYIQWNIEDMSYIKAQVENNKDKKIIIMTHHMPSFSLISEKYKSFRELNTFFSNNLDNFIIDNPHIKYWIYGHTHFPNKSIIGNTVCMVNPYGYPDENSNFNMVEFII